MNIFYFILLFNIIFLKGFSQTDNLIYEPNKYSNEKEFYDHILESSPSNGLFLYLKIIVKDDLKKNDTIYTLSKGSNIIIFLKAQSKTLDSNYFLLYSEIIYQNKMIQISSNDYYNLKFWSESIDVFTMNKKIIKKSLKGEKYFIKKYFTSYLVLKKRFYKIGKYETIVKVLFDWKIPMFMDCGEGYPVIVIR